MLKPSPFGETLSGAIRITSPFCFWPFCDHRGHFTFVDVGRAGCVGDAFTYNESSLRRKIHAGSWLVEVEEDIEDCTIKPYIIGDAAFPLEPQLMKCYDRPDFVHQKHFNRALISSRQKNRERLWVLRGSLACRC